MEASDVAVEQASAQAVGRASEQAAVQAAAADDFFRLQSLEREITQISLKINSIMVFRTMLHAPQRFDAFIDPTSI